MHWRHRRVFLTLLSTLCVIWLAMGQTLAASVAIDMNPPTVEILQPTNGSVLTGGALVEARASDGLGSGVGMVEYQVNSTLGNWTPMSLDLLSLTYKGYWETTKWPDSSYNLYVRATDNLGNASVVSISVRVGNPPATPSGLKVTEPRAPSNGGYLDLTWNPNLEADLAGYRLYRSTNETGPYTRVATPRTNQLRDSSLVNGRTYYYRVAAVDAAGNESGWTVASSGTPVDTDAPDLANLAVSNITIDAATITWTTEQPATSQVLYGTTDALGFATPVQTTLVDTHSVRLTGLRPGTMYYYKARSTDEAGNVGQSQVLTFSTIVDQPPTVIIVSPADGTVLSGAAKLQVQAGDDLGLSKVEWTWDGITWREMPFNSLSSYYEATLDPAVMGEGRHTVAARGTDNTGKTTQQLITVTIDTGAPTVGILSPVVDAHLAGGLLHTFQFTMADAGTGIAVADWQLQYAPPDVELEEAPAPVETAWAPLTYNAQTGYYEVAWTAPLVVAEKIGWVYGRAVDGLGKETVVNREITVIANGREFAFTTANGGSLFGMVTIEPIGTGKPNRIGIELLGRDLEPGKTYTLTVSGEGFSYTVSLTADARGRGEAVFEEDTEMEDEFGADLSYRED